MPRDAFGLKVQKEFCHPKCARKSSGLQRNGSLDLNHLKIVVEQRGFYFLPSSQEAITLPALPMADWVLVRISFQKPSFEEIEEVQIESSKYSSRCSFHRKIYIER